MRDLGSDTERRSTFAALEGIGSASVKVRGSLVFVGGGFGRQARSDHAVTGGSIAKQMPGTP
jgi:hypothetical protein